MLCPHTGDEIVKLWHSARHVGNIPRLHRGVGKMAYWLRELLAFGEDPGSVLSTRVAVCNCLAPVPAALMPSPGLFEHCTHTVCLHTYSDTYHRNT